MNSYNNLDLLLKELNVAFSELSSPFTVIHNKYVYNIAGTCQSDFMPAWQHIEVNLNGYIISRNKTNEIIDLIEKGFRVLLQSFKVKKEWVGKVIIHEPLASYITDEYRVRISASIIPTDKSIHDAKFHNKLMEEIDD